MRDFKKGYHQSPKHLCLLLLFLFFFPLFLFADAKPAKSVKVDARDVMQYLPELKDYEDYFSRRSRATDDARLDFHHQADDWHVSVSQRMLEILQKNPGRYDLPAEWLVGPYWEQVQASFKKSFYARRPQGSPKQFSPADDYLPYAIEAATDRGGFYGYHEWAARQSFDAIKEKGYAWLDELEQLNDGMKEFKAHEAEYFKLMAQAAAEGKAIREAMDQAEKGYCFFKDWSWELRHPLPKDFAQLPSDVECRPIESRACVAGCMELARQWSRREAALDDVLDQMLLLEYTRFFDPIGENMKGKLSGRSGGDQP